MRINLAKLQREVCIAVAWTIVLLQMASFVRGGIYGSDWVFSFIVAAVFGLLGTRRITGTWEPEIPLSHPGALDENAANRLEFAEHQRRFREEVDVLAIEVGSLADAMDFWIPKPPDDERFKGADVPTTRAIYRQYWNRRQAAFLLSLGLIGMRRAGNNQYYISGQEYREVEHRIFLEVMKFAILTGIPGSAASAQKVMKRLREDLHSVREIVLEATMAEKDWYHDRARPLIKWAIKHGLDVPVDHAFFRNALISIEEWNSDSAVDAYLGAGYAALNREAGD